MSLEVAEALAVGVGLAAALNLGAAVVHLLETRARDQREPRTDDV